MEDLREYDELWLTITCDESELMEKHIKKLKHELVDCPEKYKHLYPNKYNPQDWDLKVSM